MAGEFHWGPTNPHPLSQMRTELVWDGKYDEYGRRREVDLAACALPMQRIETVDEPRQRAEAAGQLALFEKSLAGQERDDFRNRLIWGDNKLVMASLLAEFKGKIDLIYIDPPFEVGADFTMDVPIGDGKETVEKDQSTLEMVAYRDMWGKGTDSYLHMMFERLTLMKELLSEKGSIYFHCDWHVGNYVKAVLDDVFGRDKCLNELVWKRTSARSDSHSFNHIHDVIFLFGKADSFTFNEQYTAYDASYLENFYRYVEEGSERRYRVSDLMAAGTRKGSSGKIWRGVDPNMRGNHWKYTVEKLDELDKEGRIYWPKKEGGVPGYKRYLDEMPGVPLQSVWTDINPLSAQAAENTNYTTQKPETLVERIIKASSNEGDLVADFFCGSGTTGAVAERLGRRWIMADLGRFAIHTSRKRMIEVQRTTYAGGSGGRSNLSSL